MSEYQFVAFQAVDSPLTEKQLAYARRQSTRAEASRWSFSVDYHYSSFRGDVDGLLWNGYDVYLQHTNYGIREIRLRLPRGLPFSKHVWSKYIDGERLGWTPDARGSGGILTVCPYYEPGYLEDIWETQRYLDAAVRVRELITRGDLRALYLLWLCGAGDIGLDRQETIEPPVPHGIADAKTCEGELLDFFGLDPLLLVAAGTGVEAAPADEPQDATVQWVRALDEPAAKDLLLQLLTGDAEGTRAKLLARIRASTVSTNWPVTDQQRTFDELLQRAAALRTQEQAKQDRKSQAQAERAAAKAERERAQRMQEMLKDPKRWLRESERLVNFRGTNSYQAAADLLADLREALGTPKGDTLVRRHAAHLAKKHPTLTRLKGALRQRGLLE